MRKKRLISFCKNTIICSLLIFTVPRLSAQTLTNYTFAGSTGTFTAISGATSPSLTAGSTDDGNFNAIPIGFDFWYMGTRYTTISASTNGWAAFGSTITDSFTNNLTSGGTRPLIAPLWDDLDIQASTNFSYLTSGTAGSRVFTMQWLNVLWTYLGTTASISFQVKLYESTGKIEFVYRPESGGTTFPSASTGITSSATGSGSFLSVNSAGTSVSSTVETATISAKPVSGKTYGFTPPLPLAPSALTFSSVGSNAMTLNWTDNSTNEVGYAIYSSTDGVTYSFVSQTAANATSSVQSGLVGGTTYYWKVYAVTEGGLSAAISGSQATTTVTYGNYAFQKNIILNSASIGMTGNLTNFPALLSIQDNALIINGKCADAVQNPNGSNYDFAFMDPSSGTELNYQVESYNQTTGTLLVWVKIPTLYAASNNNLTFYFGSLAPPTTHNTAFFNATWPSDYKAVYHFNEASYTGSVTDATSNGHTGTNVGMISSDLVTGKIGNAYSFNGSSKSIAVNPVNITGSFTISAWVKLGATGLDQKIMTNQSSAAYLSGGYKLGVYSNNIPEAESGVPSTRGLTPTAPTLTTGTWYYIQGVFNGTSLSVYVNGSQYSINSTTTVPFSTSNFYIGVGEGGNQLYFNGIIDEPRVSNVGKSADWLKAEYTNQNNPVTFTNSSAAVATNVTNAAAIPGALTYTWTGTTSTDPAVATNWNNTTAGTSNQLPAFTGNATFVIPAGLTNYPSLTADESIYGLTVATGAKLDLNGHVLSVACNIYNNGTGTINWNSNTASAITWNGSLAAQSYTASASTATINTGLMTINNSAAGTITISNGPVNIYNQLTLTKGSLVVGSSPAALTLKSTATLTASVNAIPAAYSITGTVNAERFLTGGSGYRGYRLLSSPVYGSTDSYSNKIYSINYLINSCFITGSTGTTGGFDKTGNPTLYLFRENMTPSNASFISGNFRGVNTIGTAPNYNYLIDGDAGTFNIPAGNGFLFFFRGDKTVGTLGAETTSTYVPTNTTLTASGTLIQGQVIVKDWYTPNSTYLGWTNATANSAVRGFNLVGNPYASSIDWETYNTTTTTTGIYANNVGITAYEFNPSTKNYDSYQKGGLSTNKGSRTIASGQGFFVQASNNTNPQLIFNESAKTTTQNTGLFLFMDTKGNNAKVNSANDQHLRLQLAKDSINTDDIYIGFNSSYQRQYVYNEDAEYKPGSGVVSLASFSADNVPLAINKLPLPKQSDTIALRTNIRADGLYSLNMTELQGISRLFQVWLMDYYKKDSLDIKHNPSYAFNVIKADTNTFGSKRFSLIIRQDPALGVHLLAFAAAKATDGVQLTWKTENEEDYTNFTIERSIDNGLSFTVVGGFLSSSEGTYSLTDKKPSLLGDEYRLKIEDLNGTISYSKIITLRYSAVSGDMANNNINVYPNPAKNLVNLSILSNSSANQPSLQSAGAAFKYTGNIQYNVQIVNNAGIVIKATTITSNNWKTDIAGFIPGTYFIKVINNRDKSLVGRAKFVKM